MFPNTDIEVLLREFLDQHLAKKDGITPPNLAESIRYSLLSPGKRLRPRLLLAGAELVGVPQASAIPAALALEMIHCFTLIHDDLPCMDNDDFRRGLPTNHKKFGESLALLAGDALVPLATEVFLDSPHESTQLLEGLKRFLWAMGPRGVMGGQASEALLSSQSDFSEIRNLHRLKTGALFSAALLIPKDLAGITDESREGQSIAFFADELGFAFQVADDLEDETPTENQKPAPTSILFYLSANKARQMAIEGLTVATEKLVQVWGQKSLKLKEISDEVIRKTEAVRS